MVEYNNAHRSQYATYSLDAAFTAMADPIRRAILERLAIGEARVTELAADFPVSLNAVSKHIKILERSKLLKRDIRGRDHVLSLNAEGMIDAAQWIDNYRQFWEINLKSLEHYITNQRESAKKGNNK